MHASLILYPEMIKMRWGRYTQKEANCSRLGNSMDVWTKRKFPFRRELHYS
jgi:hypothetical protein